MAETDLITLSRATVQQVLDALEDLAESAEPDCDEENCGDCKSWRPAWAAIAALKAALKQPYPYPAHEYRKGFIDGQIEMRDRPEEQPEQEPELRELLIGAAAMAVAAERKGAYQGASWVADAVLAQPEQEQGTEQQHPARQRFDDTGGREEPDPVERLRFFCSLAMNKQDWLDVEAFFDDVLAERQKNAALEQPVQCMAHGECFGGQCIYTSRSGQPEQDTDCHAQGICQRSGYSIGQLEQDPDRWGAGYEAGYAAGMAEMKPEQAEPVAVFDEQQGSPVLLASAPMLSDGQSLYTRPPRREWRSLSEKEIGDVFHAARNAKLGAANDNSRHRLSVVEIARAVEAKLKEKNHE